MVYKIMRKRLSAFLMTVLILCMVVSTTIVGAVFCGSTASSCGVLSEENEQTICTSAEDSFQLLFGVIFTDAIITEVIYWPDEEYYIFFCEPLDRVTVVGFGTYSSPVLNEQFYIKTFYNVSSIMGGSFKEVEVTGDYQTIISFHLPVTPCILYFS